MGVVYRASHVELARRVALKLISPELAGDEDFRRRFERESRLAASIEHPNVIPVYDAGEIEGHVFISMRLVEGRDLRGTLKDGALSPDQTSAMVAQVAAALDAAHAAGLVHRDVKPGNILLERRGGTAEAFLTDFGLTKHVSSDTHLTQSGQFVGTVDYIAPEQARGEPVDARTDVYSLTAVLYEALTGEVPYPRESSVAKLMAHLNDPVPSVSRRNGTEVPDAFEHVIRRGMAKDPRKRFPSAGDLARASSAAAAGRKPPRAERSVARGQAAPTRSRRFALGAVGALVFLALAAAAAFAVVQVASDDPSEPTQQPAAESTGGGGVDGGGAEDLVSADEEPRVVSVDTSGPQSLEDFQPQFHGLAVAKSLFGPPTEATASGSDTCTVRWDDEGVVILFANFGGDDACEPEGSLVQYYGVGGDGPAASRWETEEGLGVGDSVSRLHALYPGSHVTTDVDETALPADNPGQRAWSIVETSSPFGDGSTALVYLAALEAGGRITGFTGYVGNAGE